MEILDQLRNFLVPISVQVVGFVMDFLDTIFRPAIALAASLFSIFFAWKKIGNSVHVTYSTDSSILSQSRIGNLIFQNKKDKPVELLLYLRVSIA